VEAEVMRDEKNEEAEYVGSVVWGEEDDDKVAVLLHQQHLNASSDDPSDTPGN
jgi:hypothetical protein